MTSGSLYFKLLKEDLKRRLWAIALVCLVFFFTLPIGLALNMEKAASTDYYRYNDYNAFVRDASMTDVQYQARITDLKTKVVLGEVEYGNEMIALLMITAAVVIGVSGFAYLHNKKKVDFYHSLPVRREALFASQYMGGIFIMAAAYGVNLLLLLGVALSYGVPLNRFLGVMAGGWVLNMLYYSLMYAVTVAAMMMTGNIVVGVLGTGVFFFFLPAVMLLLAGYCETFFVTTARYMWSSEESPFGWGVKYLSPFSVYINSFGWKMKEMSGHVPELICTVLAFLAVTTLDLELYRKRPSEAAGKAMAFKKIMAPIRILLVLGIGLGGGMFFWMLQSRMRWGIFGILMSVLMTHCIVEIIYHFDFKKLFCHRLQMGLCLAAGVLVFLSFRYDWYGYDSYMPDVDKIASASLEIDGDSGWLSNKSFSAREDGSLEIIYEPAYEYIEKNMTLTDMDAVMPIVEEGRKRALEGRDGRLGIRKTVVRVSDAANRNSAVSYIGGADGPTSVFLAFKTGRGDQEAGKEKYYTNVTVCYRLMNGRQVRRTYSLPLSSVMDSYKALFDQEEYKDGLYPILSQDGNQVKRAQYREAGDYMDAGQDSRVLAAILKAYQEDLRDLTVEQKIAQAPVGSIIFTSAQEDTYLGQQGQLYQKYHGGYAVEDIYTDLCQPWPVYPSFTRTIELLEEQGIRPGTYFAPENVEKITVDVEDNFYETVGQLPEGEALAELQRINPYYQEDGTLVFRDQESIRLMMGTLAEEECIRMNQMVANGMYCRVWLKGGDVASRFQVNSRMSPEAEALFAGIPVVTE